LISLVFSCCLSPDSALDQKDGDVILELTKLIIVALISLSPVGEELIAIRQAQPWDCLFFLLPG